MFAPGELEAAPLISYGLPDVRHAAHHQYAGKHTLVVGGGHSAATVLIDLTRLAEDDELTRITWAVRNRNPMRVFGGGETDQLPARGKLGNDLKRLVEARAFDS